MISRGQLDHYVEILQKNLDNWIDYYNNKKCIREKSAIEKHQWLLYSLKKRFETVKI